MNEKQKVEFEKEYKKLHKKTMKEFEFLIMQFTQKLIDIFPEKNEK